MSTIARFSLAEYVTIYSGDEEVRPLAFPKIVLRPSLLWIPADSE